MGKQQGLFHALLLDCFFFFPLWGGRGESLRLKERYFIAKETRTRKPPTASQRQLKKQKTKKESLKKKE